MASFTRQVENRGIIQHMDSKHPYQTDSLIFQTKDDEKLDNWTEKITVLKKSFHDIGSSISNARRITKEEKGNFWSILKRDLSSKEVIPELMGEDQIQMYLDLIKSHEEIPTKNKGKKRKKNIRKTFSEKEWAEYLNIDLV